MLSRSESSLQTAYSMVENSPCIFHSSNICFSFFTLTLNAIFHRAMEAHSHVLAFRGECLDCIMHMHSLAFAYAASCVCNTIYIIAPQRELRPNNVALARVCRQNYSECTSFRATYYASYTSRRLASNFIDIDSNEH